MSGPCPNVVIFDWCIWSALYPSLVAAGVTEAQACQYFQDATLYVSNEPTSRIRVPIRARILGLLTAHIATLFASLNGQAPNPLVGRLTNASQGSVNLAVDMTGPQAAAWFNQTPYGAAAWQAMLSQSLGGRYRPGPQPYLGTGAVIGGGFV